MLDPNPHMGSAVDGHSHADLEHWPDEIWSDYPAAYVRMTTLRVDREHHLLFGCVELLPRETVLLPGYNAPRLALPRGATAMSSLTVLATGAALRCPWFPMGTPDEATPMSSTLAPASRKGASSPASTSPGRAMLAVPTGADDA